MIFFFSAFGLPAALFDGKGLVMLAIGLALTIFIPYLMGSINSAIIVSNACYRDDIRKYGSGNAGLTNMNRVYGGKAAAMTFAGDVLKQVISVALGVLLLGQVGAYISGMFCMLGHIAPVFYGFKGGKGVLTAATLILLIDWQVFLVLAVVFFMTVLLTRYVSLGSLLAAFAFPGVVYYAQALRSDVGISDPLSMICAVLIGCIIFVTHRANIKRLFNGTESKIKFKKSVEFQAVLDKEDPENDRIREQEEFERELQDKEDRKKFKAYNRKRLRNMAKQSRKKRK